MKIPRLDDLIGADVPAGERERLQRVHELLVEAGPPPELPPRLMQPPGEKPLADVHVLPRGLPRRRLAAALVLAAALAAAAFGTGYLVGDSGDSAAPVAGAEFRAQRAVTLQGKAAPGATAVVRIGPSESGNVPMLVTVEGLDRLPVGDYYVLYMTKDGKRKVACGTFNVKGGNDRSEIEFSVGYDLAGFDGFAVTEWRQEGHKEFTLLTGKLA